MNLNGPLGRPPGVGWRLVKKVFKTAGTYNISLPADMQPWMTILLECEGGGGASGAGGSGTSMAASGGSGGGAGGAVRGLRTGFVVGQILTAVVGAASSTSSITIPAISSGNMSATGGSNGVNGSQSSTFAQGTTGGTGGTGSGAPTDEIYTGQSGDDSGPSLVIIAPCVETLYLSGWGGRGANDCLGYGRGGRQTAGLTGLPNVPGIAGQAALGNGAGSSGGSGAIGSGAGGASAAGSSGIITLSVWTQDPNYVPTVT